MTATQSKTETRTRTVTISGRIGDASRLMSIAIATARKTMAPRVEVHQYLVKVIGSDFGDGFRLVKLSKGTDPEADHYDCHLSNEGHVCECRGNLKHGHCRHVDALVALRHADKI